MKKKILFCSYSLDIGGIETGLINLLNNLDYDKYEITLILEKKEGLLFDRLNKNVKVVEYRVSDCKNIFLRKFKNLFKKLFWLVKNYHKYSFSCCFATYSLPCNFLAYFGSKNNVFYVHSNYKYIYDEEGLRSFFDVRRIDKFKHIVFVSNESKNDLCSFYPSIKDKSLVINNLINYKEILSMSEEKIDFKKTKETLFVFIGRLEEHSKKLSKLINVVNELSGVKLLIIGDGPDRKMYEKMIGNNSNITMVGSKKNPYPYMKLADYIVLTSDYEGFPLVYSEAIVLNKKIISTIDVSDDFISIPNRFGYIISKNKDEMIEQIKSILNSDELTYDNVDFDKLNSSKISRIEDLIEEVI